MTEAQAFARIKAALATPGTEPRLVLVLTRAGDGALLTEVFGPADIHPREIRAAAAALTTTAAEHAQTAAGAGRN